MIVERHHRARPWMVDHHAPEAALCWWAADVDTIDEVPVDQLGVLARACADWKKGLLAADLFRPDQAVIDTRRAPSTRRAIDQLCLRRNGVPVRRVGQAERAIVTQTCGRPVAAKALTADEHDLVLHTVALIADGQLTWDDTGRRWQPDELIPRAGRTRQLPYDPMAVVRDVTPAQVADWLNRGGTLDQYAATIVTPPHVDQAATRLRRQLAVAGDMGLIIPERPRSVA